MFLFQDARRKGGGVVARKNRHARLGKDRSGVELGGHEVNRASVLGEPLGERALVGVEAAQMRQQRRMNVENAPRHRSTKGGLSTRMNPARQTSSTEAAVSRASSAASNAGLPA